MPNHLRVDDGVRRDARQPQRGTGRIPFEDDVVHGTHELHQISADRHSHVLTPGCIANPREASAELRLGRRAPLRLHDHSTLSIAERYYKLAAADPYERALGIHAKRVVIVVTHVPLLDYPTTAPTCASAVTAQELAHQHAMARVHALLAWHDVRFVSTATPMVALVDKDTFTLRSQSRELLIDHRQSVLTRLRFTTCLC
ncbi:hypothetical protein MICRO8M_90014 [Microbacterium sp. 8M]|nr:hypothetical protein MICRO8M_90014 [Microbacterium sp. 8M]